MCVILLIVARIIDSRQCRDPIVFEQTRIAVDGEHDIRVKGNIRSNSAEFVRTALMSGLGLALRSIWDIGPELQRGELKVVLPQYRGADTVAIYAVYPCRDFMPTKVNALIEFLADLYGSEPYWDKAYDGGRAAARAVPKIDAGVKIDASATVGAKIDVGLKDVTGKTVKVTPRAQTVTR